MLPSGRRPNPGYDNRGVKPEDVVAARLRLGFAGQRAIVAAHSQHSQQLERAIPDAKPSREL